MQVQLQPNLGVVPRGQPNLLVTPNPDLEPYNAHVFRLDQTLNGKHKFFVQALTAGVPGKAAKFKFKVVRK